MPSGSDVTQRTDEQPAFSADQLELFLQPSNLVSAWKQVRANKGAAGIDGMTIDDFPAWANAGNWKRVMTALRSGQYQPSPVKRVEIDKPDGGKRQLGSQLSLTVLSNKRLPKSLRLFSTQPSQIIVLGSGHIEMGNKQ